MIDLTGDPIVEEQIRQYYVMKKGKEERLKVEFVEGVETRERERAKFTIDNSYVLEVPQEEMELYNRNNSKAWSRHEKADKTRRRLEAQYLESLTN